MTSTFPIHGFVLAGGQSSRMGTDKALMDFGGKPMVAIAIKTLAATCASVTITGNQGDLAAFGTVLPDSRPGEGPASAIESGMLACELEWAMFMPVDLPLMSPDFVRRWAEAVLARAGTRASYVALEGDPHPALCLIRKECANQLVTSIQQGNRRLQALLGSLKGLWIANAGEFADPSLAAEWFSNVNTPDDFDRAERRQTALQLPMRKDVDHR